MSWRNVKRLAAKHGRPFVTVAAHHNHGKLAVDVDGATWWIAGDDCEPYDAFGTTTAKYIRTGNRTGMPDEWAAEVDRRRSDPSVTRLQP
jgi:hypothetical protein